MKILKIQFKNINSLKGEHHIDFTEAPFDTSPLFAITGPTGSGKSTLLDVISLALFNQVPRLGKISKKEILAKGALLTRNQKEASASVTYQCKSGIFTSSWSISTNRNNLLRDYDMEIADEAGAILDLKKSRVPEHNEKLIGLNYDQFIKSVLLAQGEFAQFLKAKKDERGALLEKITGTGIYRELGRKAYERFKTEERKIEKQQTEIQTHQSELLEDAVLKDSTEEFKTREESIPKIEIQIKQLEKGIGLKQSLIKTRKELVSAQEKQALEKEKMIAFLEGPGISLRNHENLRPVADELRLWSTLQDQLATLDKQMAKLSETKENNRSDIDTFVKGVTGFIGKETDVDNLEKDIDEFSEAVRALQNIRDTKRKEHAQVKSIIEEQARETAFEYRPNVDAIATLTALQSDSEKKLSGFLKVTGISPTADVGIFREALKEKLNRSRQLEKKDIALKQEQKNLNQYLAETEQLAIRQKALPNEMELAESKAKRFDAEANALQKSMELQRLRASLEEHRANLKLNEPCPLCGSLEHPYAKHSPTHLDKENELDALQKESKEWEAVFSSKKSELNTARARENELKSKIASVTEEIKALTAQETKLAQGLLLPSGDSWENYSKVYQQKLEALTLLENEKKRLASYRKIGPNLEKLKTITFEGSEISRQLQQKYEGTNINTETQDKLKRWTALRKEQQLVNNQLDTFEKESKTKNNEIHILEKRLIRTDSLTNFTTIAEARKVLLDEYTFSQLQSEKNNIGRALDQSKTTIDILIKQREADIKEDVADTLEQLQEHYLTNQKLLKTFREEQNELERLLTNHKEKTAKITALKQQIAEEEKQIKRWKLLNELIGDAQGKKFNDFAQDLTLRHLVALANIRLVDLSDRYRLNTPNDEEDDGLIVRDDHMGGQRRSVKTLSGGETFLLSLSMALALSDLASSNVEINSLFIDEGFGTLDPETLDQTLDTLEKLQSESSKTIGIISHVDALKERIATQIQLKRNGQGYSSLKVV